MDLLDTGVYAIIGDEGFTRLVDAFYRRVADDEILRPLYPEEDLAAAEIRLREFLIQRFGGPMAYSEKRGHNFALNGTFDQIRPEDYDALVLPGGRAPEYIRLIPRVIEIVHHYSKANKPIAAICHAAQILAAAGVLKGKKCSAYPAVGPDVSQAGGTYVNLAMTEAMADGNLVTAPAWPAHPAWLAKFLAVLGTRIEL